MTVASNGPFWLFTIALLIFLIIILTTALNGEYNRIKYKISLPQTKTEDESKYTGICKNLCKLCDCLGFYCGEECICECNDDRTDTECIRKIQIKGQSLNVPFEVLIQGPTANKFVRNALLYEQNQERKLAQCRRKRSTVTVYKPNKASLSAEKYSCEKKTVLKDIFKPTDNPHDRRKRSTGNNNFEWFSNLGTNLLRPAPLGVRKPKVEGIKKPHPKTTTASSIFGNAWIFDNFDNTRNILTPRPLKIRKNPKTKKSSSEKTEDLSTEEGGSSDDVAECSKSADSNKHKESKAATKSNKKKSSLSDPETDAEKSQENLIGSLYKGLFQNMFDKRNERYSSAAASAEHDQKEEPRETFLYNDELDEMENDEIDLFAEEQEENERPSNKLQQSKTSDLSKSPDDGLYASEKLMPLDIKKGLQALFKPERLLQKFRQVMNS